MVPRRPQQPPRMGQQSRFRVLHAIPDAPAVDVYVDGRRVASNLSFGRYTDYLPTTPGRHRVELTRAGTRNPILTQTIAVPMRDYLTIAAIDSARGPRVEPELAIYEDDPRTPPQKSRVRFIHLSPDAPAVDVFAARGRAAYQPLFRNVSYRTSTDYRTLNPGQYNLAVRAAGTNNTLLTVPNINLQANRAYTIAAIGKAEGQPRLRGLIMPH
ncbi:DUF4397 domain-containing protein [Melghirimyces profundicolus]|nr:DUF4397 domain-containing protein [Melghirimyces profundicolus]